MGGYTLLFLCFSAADYNKAYGMYKIANNIL